jgi:hypothetical protein
MTTFDDCGKGVKGKYQLSEEQYSALQSELKDIMIQLKESDVDIDEVLNKTLHRKLATIKQTETQRMLNKAKLIELTDYIKQSAFKGDTMSALKSLIEPVTKYAYKGVGSLWNSKQAYANRVQSMIDMPAYSNKSMNKLTTGVIDRDIFDIIINKNRAGYDKSTLEIADGIIKANRHVYEIKKRAGVDLGFIDNYLIKQSHDPEMMFTMKLDPWKELAVKSFDFKKMGIDPLDVDAYLTSFYNGKIDQLAELRGTKLSDDEFRQIETSIFVERMGRSRTVEFKDGDAAYNYFKAMNPDATLYSKLISGVDRDASRLAAMEMFGPNFKMTFKALTRVAKKDFFTKTEGDLKAKLKFDQEQKNLETMFKGVTEGEFQGKMNWIAVTGDALRKITNMSKLGNALVTTITDLSYGAAILSSTTGRNFHHELAALAMDSFKMFTSNADRQKAAGELLSFVNDINGSTVNTRYGEYGRGHDRLSKIHDTFMKYTGLQRQASSAKLAISKRMAKFLAEDSDLPFDKLAGKTSLMKFGIGEKEWNLMRKAKTTLGETEGAYITPSSIMDLPDSDFPGLTGTDLVFAKLDLSQKLQQWMSFYSERGSPTAGAKQFTLKNAYDRNSFQGQMMQMMFQFKSFIFASLHTMETIKNTGHENFKYGNIQNIANTVVAGSALGAIAITARDILANREPQLFQLANQTEQSGMTDKDVLQGWVKFGFESLLQSGTGGMFFDIFFDDYSKGYVNLPSKLAGPVISGIGDDFFSLTSEILRTDWSEESERTKLLRDTLVAIEKNAPQIPFTRALINKNIFDLMHKQLNTERRPSKQKKLI